jgi:isoleucyl-tRNA synthetase
VQAQLRAFYTIYARGLVFREHMPVYWSPSSKTALAEAELEYNPRHVSTAVYVRFKLVRRPPLPVVVSGSGDMYAVIWTTTPWSLPANRAICYNAGDEYAVLGGGGEEDCCYIVSAALVESPAVRAALPDGARVLSKFSGKLLEGDDLTLLFFQRTSFCLYR